MFANQVKAVSIQPTALGPLERKMREQAGAAFWGHYLLANVTILAEFAHYIKANGGAVTGVVVMVNAGRSGRLVPERQS